MVPGKLPRLTRRQQVIAALSAVALLIVVLVLTGADSAARLTAAGTILLGAGTIGLAAGAIGTYVEQRRQIAQQQHQLEAAKENDIAQILVRRLSGPGQFMEVEIANHSRRAIRAVYVWADIDRVTGHYQAVVKEKDSPSGQMVISRRMRVWRITVGSAQA